MLQNKFHSARIEGTGAARCSVNEKKSFETRVDRNERKLKSVSLES
jgi:hypothetical protein